MPSSKPPELWEKQPDCETIIIPPEPDLRSYLYLIFATERVAHVGWIANHTPELISLRDVRDLEITDQLSPAVCVRLGRLLEAYYKTVSQRVVLVDVMLVRFCIYRGGCLSLGWLTQDEHERLADFHLRWRPK